MPLPHICPQAARHVEDRCQTLFRLGIVAMKLPSIRRLLSNLGYLLTNGIVSYYSQSYPNFRLVLNYNLSRMHLAWQRRNQVVSHQSGLLLVCDDLNITELSLRTRTDQEAAARPNRFSG